MFMWIGLLLLVCLVDASQSDAVAQEYPPMPSDCLAIAAQIEIETHARFVRKSTSTLFYDPGLPSYSVALDWEQGSVPPKAFYDLAGRAGAILTANQKR